MNCSKCPDKTCCKVFYIRVHPSMLPIMKDPSFAEYLKFHGLEMDGGYIIKKGKCLALDQHGFCMAKRPAVCMRDGPEFDNHADVMCPAEAWDG